MEVQTNTHTLDIAHPSPLSPPSPSLDFADNNAPLLDTVEDTAQQEDLNLEHPASPSPSPSSANMSTYHYQQQHPNQASPPPVIVHSKQAKKRKSWGQELPEPKTKLPPRKRAKTDDEKEQRRIERIKRNRAAAHNSRERKRQEAENLAVLLAKANAELEAYRNLHGPLPAHIVLPEVTVRMEEESTPAPSLVESHGSMESATSPTSTTPNGHPRHSHQIHIKQEPLDYSFPSSTLAPSDLENSDLKAISSSVPSLDQTQHSAAMLSSDLPCQSSSSALPMAIAMASETSRPSTQQACSTSTWATSSSLSPSSSNAAMAWIGVFSRIFLQLITIYVQNYYRSILVAMWTISPSRMTRLIQASTTRLTRTSPLRTSSTTLQSAMLTRPHSRSNMAMAQLNAATGLTTNMRSGSASALHRAAALSAGQQRALMAILKAKAEAKRRCLAGQRYSSDFPGGVHGDQADEKHDGTKTG